MRGNTIAVKWLRPWLLALLIGRPACTFAEFKIERVEPPHWWVGMQDSSLQLMVHGQDIAGALPSLDRKDVSITRITRSSNPNYLFIDLMIAPQAIAGPLTLSFRKDQQVLRYRYSLEARAPGSAQRKSFDSSDAILNLMPDRFANGDPSNDQVLGLVDVSKRDDPNARHGGDIKGIVQHLDYIKAMGYTMIWPTPLVENAQLRHSYHGYAATDLYKIDARFGSNADYKNMVSAARQKGLGVIQDVVLNHIGDQHWWMRDLPNEWTTNSGKFTPTHHARTTVSDLYAAKLDKEDFTRGWFVPTMPDLNQHNPLVATYLIQNSIWWLEYAGVSGLRVDTFGYSDTQFLEFWTQRLRREYPNLSMVGEEWSTNPVVVARWLQDHPNWSNVKPGMPNMMDFPIAEGMRGAFTEDETQNAGLEKLYLMLANDVLYPTPNKLVLFEGNHDMPRIFSALNDDLNLYRMALIYVATLPRIPQFYYGTEVLMPSPKIRDDAAARRDFPGGWAGDTVNAFTGEGLTQPQTQAQRFLRTLLNWRKTASAVHSGTMLHFQPRDGVYVYFRYNTAQRFMVIFNKNASAITLDLARFEEGIAGAKTATEVLTGAQMKLSAQLQVPARGAWILALAH
jgi:neopullulanase